MKVGTRYLHRLFQKAVVMLQSFVRASDRRIQTSWQYTTVLPSLRRETWDWQVSSSTTMVKKKKKFNHSNTENYCELIWFRHPPQYCDSDKSKTFEIWEWEASTSDYDGRKNLIQRPWVWKKWKVLTRNIWRRRNIWSWNIVMTMFLSFWLMLHCPQRYDLVLQHTRASR